MQAGTCCSKLDDVVTGDKSSSTVKELLAVLQLVRQFKVCFAGHHVRGYLDSSAASDCLNHAGGHTVDGIVVCKAIWLELHSVGLFIYSVGATIVECSGRCTESSVCSQPS